MAVAESLSPTVLTTLTRRTVFSDFPTSRMPIHCPDSKTFPMPGADADDSIMRARS